MKLATLKNGTPDGQLYIVTRDLSRCAPAQAAVTMQAALEDWDNIQPLLQSEYEKLESEGGEVFDGSQAMAPLPRAWQWLDGSAFASHGELMDKVFGLEPMEDTGRPLMYQGVSDKFYGANEDVRMPTEEVGIDFEGEFGVITKSVPMGTSSEDAQSHIALVVQINDWSLRKLAPIEMKTGFGWVQAKPPCTIAPVAVTPDELGDSWRDSRVDLPLLVNWNDKQFGAANGYHMSFGFHELVAHAAFSRDLVAGTVIGSGTVSNENYREIGSSCIAERRGIEMLDQGEPKTDYMSFGDSVSMECIGTDGQSIFGQINQKVVKA